MPITYDDLKRMSEELSRLPRRRKSYSRKGAMEFLADKILFLLHEGRSLESIFWRLERKFRISEEAVLEALLDRLKEERPNEDPERVLAEIIDEGRPAVETTATPRIIEQPTPVAGSLPEPEEAGLASPEPEGGIQNSPDRATNEQPAGISSQDKATSARQAGIPAPAFGDGSGLAKLQNYE
jgi:hypothetical protein